MVSKNQLRKGVFFAFLTALISAVSITYSKIAVVKIDPLVLTAARNSYVGLLFLFYFIFTKKFSHLKKLKKNETLFLVLIGLIGGALPFYLFFSGLKLIPAPTANLIHKSLFVWVTLLAAVFLKEKLHLSYLLGFILIVFANFFFIPPPKLGFSTGEIFVLSATLLWSIENILAKKVLKTVASETVGLFRMGIGGLILVSFVFLQGKTALFLKITASQWLMIFTGATLLFFYVFSWYKALKFLPASLATLILSVATIIGNLFSAFVIKTPFSSKELSQLILYFFAFVIIFFGQKEILTLRFGKK